MSEQKTKICALNPLKVNMHKELNWQNVAKFFSQKDEDYAVHKNIVYVVNLIILNASALPFK